MSSGDSPFSQQSITESPGDVRSLFRRCAETQKKVAKFKPSNLGESFDRQAAFFEPLFPRTPDNLDRTDLLIWKGQLHEALVKLLKTATNDETFLYLLVQWMRSEGIRPPDDFFQLRGLRQLTKGAGFSGADIRNAYLVRGWLPYTEPLVRKWKWLRESESKNPGDSLLALGYDSAAVDLVCSPRKVAGAAGPRWGSAVEFTCEWVASRSLGTSTEYQRETLRNSYSRFFRKSRYRLSTCSFCDQAAEDEFWAYGSPVLHCGEHKADRLPISESTACTDRVGRRWWRDNLNVRYTAAPSVSS